MLIKPNVFGLKNDIVIKVESKKVYTYGNKHYFSAVGLARAIARTKIWNKPRLAERFSNEWGKVNCDYRFDRYDPGYIWGCELCNYKALRERYTKIILKRIKMIV